MLSNADRRRMMTPSGRMPDDRHWAGWGEPRPPGPTQNLIPVGRPGRLPQARAAPTVPNLESLPIAMLKLDSPAVIPGQGQPQIPWQYLFINLWRLAQPTGVTPGTANGITVNAHGQVINTQGSGASIDSPNLTGNPTSVTPPANDNSNAIATTAWVQGQNYATESFVTSQNFATEPWVQSFVASQGFATQAWVHQQGYITDAPADGQRYVRQNGAWVVIVSP